MAESFGDVLQARIRERGPLCLGVDPSAATLLAWEREDSVEGLEYVALALLEAASSVAVAVKPQVAFFERWGSQGIRVLERFIHEARSASVLVIADAKRGDIGSTNDGYAHAWLHPQSPLASDAVTLSPYLGVGALEPFFATAREFSKGVFVLAATSNPEGRFVQTARSTDHRSVEVSILEYLRELNHSADNVGYAGAVVGATRDRPDFDFATMRGPFLVPGVGAQGAGPDDVARLFANCATGVVLPTVSRAIAQAGPDVKAVRDRAARWRDDLISVLL
jgi:orotidine-5'-phosphate decarboxylase